MEMMFNRWISVGLSAIRDLGESTWKIVYWTFLGNVEQSNMIRYHDIMTRMVNLTCHHVCDISSGFRQLNIEVQVTNKYAEPHPREFCS